MVVTLLLTPRGDLTVGGVKICHKNLLQVPDADAATEQGTAFRKLCGRLPPAELLLVAKALGLGEGGDNDKDRALLVNLHNFLVRDNTGTLDAAPGNLMEKATGEISARAAAAADVAGGVAGKLGNPNELRAMLHLPPFTPEGLAGTIDPALAFEGAPTLGAITQGLAVLICGGKAFSVRGVKIPAPAAAVPTEAEIEHAVREVTGAFAMREPARPLIATKVLALAEGGVARWDDLTGEVQADLLDSWAGARAALTGGDADAIATEVAAAAATATRTATVAGVRVLCGGGEGGGGGPGHSPSGAAASSSSIVQETAMAVAITMAEVLSQQMRPAAAASSPFKDRAEEAKAAVATGAITEKIRKAIALPLGIEDVQAVAPTVWRAAAREYGRRALATLGADEYARMFADCFPTDDLRNPAAPLAPRTIRMTSRKALDYWDAAAAAPTVVGGEGGGAAPSSKGPTALYGLQETFVCLAALQIVETGSIASDPAAMLTVTQTVCELARQADAGKGFVVGPDAIEAGAEWAFAYRALTAVDKVATAMSGYLGPDPARAAPAAVPAATLTYQDAARFALTALGYGGIVFLDYTPGLRNLYHSSAQRGEAWGPPPPRFDGSMGGAAPLAPGPGPGAAAGAAPGGGKRRLTSDLRLPEGHTLPAVLCGYAPADTARVVPPAARISCWVCGRSPTTCPAPHACGARGGKPVLPIGPARSWDEAYEATAAAAAKRAKP